MKRVRQPVSEAPTRRTWAWRLGAVVSLAAMSALPALGGTFLWDDAILLLIKDKHPREFWFSLHQPDYWPVTYTVLWLVWKLSHGSPFVFHVVNLAVHLVNTGLWASLLRRGGCSERVALVAAALFAVHPLQVEAVAYVFQLKTTLALTFFLLSVLAYVRARGWRGRLVSLGLFALACLTKTSAVMLPAALALWELRSGWSQWKDKALRLLPFAGLALASAALTVFMSRQNAVHTVVWNATPLERVLTAAYNAWFYLVKFFVPVGLTVAAPRTVLSPSSLVGWVPLLGWGVTAAVVVLNRHRPWVLAVGAGLAFAVSQLLPVLGLVNIFFMKWSLVADHWAYVALMGFCVPLALLVDRLPSGPRRGVTVALLISLASASASRSMVFRSPERLWADTLAKNPQADLAHTSLGHMAYEKKDYATALGHYQAAASARPDNDEAHFGVGAALVGLGRPAEAEPHFARARSLNPFHAKAHNELGVMALDRKQNAEAQRLLERAIELDPSFAEAHGNLALVAQAQGDLPRALEALQRAAALRPSDDRLQTNLGSVLIALGRWTEAEAALKRALTLNPSQAFAHFNLARIYKRQPGQRARAIEALEAGLQLAPGNADARRELESLERDAPH
jgi:protein O-mannosyl-transferase